MLCFLQCLFRQKNLYLLMEIINRKKNVIKWQKVCSVNQEFDKIPDFVITFKNTRNRHVLSFIFHKISWS